MKEACREKENKSFWEKSKGSVSIFFMIINLIFFVFSSICIDFSRLLVAERQMELSAKAAVQSILTDYNKEIFEGYGLFLNQTDNSRASQIAKRIVTDNLSSKQGYYNVTQLSNPTSTVDFQLKNRTFLNEKTYEHQILESVKYTGVYSFGSDTVEMLKVFQENSTDLKMMKKLAEKQKKIQENMEDRLESVEDIQEAIKNVSVENISQKAPSVADLKDWAKDYVFYIKAGNHFKAKMENAKSRSDTYIEMYNGMSDEEKELNLELVNGVIYRGNQYIDSYNEMVNAYNKSSNKLVDAQSTIEVCIDDYKKIESKIVHIRVSYREVKEKNEEIKKLYKEIPKGQTNETSEIKKSLEKAIVPDEILKELDKEIKNLEKIKDLIETSDQIATFITDVLTVDSNDSHSYDSTLVPSEIKIRDSNMSSELIKNTVKNDFTKARNATVEGNNLDFPSNAKQKKYEKNLSDTKSLVTKVNNGVYKVKEIVKNEELTQELDDAAKKLKDDADKEAEGGMKNVLNYLDAFNALLDGKEGDQENYDELKKIMAKLDGDAASYDEMQIASTSDPSDFISESSGIMEKLFGLLEGLRNDVLINEYYLNEFGTNQPQDLLSGSNLTPEGLVGMNELLMLENKQVEYIMYGKHKASSNYGSALMELMMIRVVVNLLSGAFDNKVIKAFKTHFLVGLAALIAYVIVETVGDMVKLTKAGKTLRDNRSVSMFKKKGTPLYNVKFTYKDHLRMMMLYKNEEGMLQRSLALIEHNEAGVTNIGGKSTEVSVTVTADFKPWFLPMAMEHISALNGIGSKMKNGKIPLKKTLYLGY